MYGTLIMPVEFGVCWIIAVVTLEFLPSSRADNCSNDDQSGQHVVVN